MFLFLCVTEAGFEPAYHVIKGVKRFTLMMLPAKGACYHKAVTWFSYDVVHQPCVYRFRHSVKRERGLCWLPL